MTITIHTAACVGITNRCATREKGCRPYDYTRPSLLHPMTNASSGLRTATAGRWVRCV